MLLLLLPLLLPLLLLLVMVMLLAGWMIAAHGHVPLALGLAIGPAEPAPPAALPLVSLLRHCHRRQTGVAALKLPLVVADVVISVIIVGLKPAVVLPIAVFFVV